MKTLLICHEHATLNRNGLPRWLASFSDLAGIVVLRDSQRRMWRQLRREIKRVGFIRFLDVAAFRVYYRFFLSKSDQLWETKKLGWLQSVYTAIPAGIPVFYTTNPNTPETEEFIRRVSPDIMIARCKMLLKEKIFTIPTHGTFVMHPGICPEYRNSHGCFWALVNGELNNVGMTLLRIDKGIDSGPVYGYYTYEFDERSESHVVIQQRVVFENLNALKCKLLDIYAGSAIPIDTSGRRSAMWGAPWLTAHLWWKWKARQRSKCKSFRSITTT
ncbi:MAG TPA: formyltransferase family protein [Bryobacteraceae bacterium]|nr:formyltransferase family protein [Bryobacteraceae bacterium]HXJ41225.1 formyltransferase family protein [Bryobacteraceae bacterium]